MTVDEEQITTPREPALERRTAMRLAQTEYQRFQQMLEQLAPEDWAKPTDCGEWDVRAVAGHCLGMAEMAASMRETVHQTRAAKRRGGVMIDALTAVQVEERVHLSPDEVVARFSRVVPKAT